MGEIVVMVNPIMRSGLKVGGHGFVAYRERQQNGKFKYHGYILRGGPHPNGNLVGSIEGPGAKNSIDMTGFIAADPEDRAIEVIYSAADAAHKFNAMLTIVQAGMVLPQPGSQAPKYASFDDTGFPYDAYDLWGGDVSNSNTYIFELLKAVGIAPTNPAAMAQRWRDDRGLYTPGFFDHPQLEVSPSPGFGVYSTASEPSNSSSSSGSSPSRQSSKQR